MFGFFIHLLFPFSFGRTFYGHGCEGNSFYYMETFEADQSGELILITFSLFSLSKNGSKGHRSGIYT